MSPESGEAGLAVLRMRETAVFLVRERELAPVLLPALAVEALGELDAELATGVRFFAFAFVAGAEGALALAFLPRDIARSS